jgi:hypothetical protein
MIKLDNRKKIGVLLLLIFLVIMVFVLRKDKPAVVQEETQLEEVVKNIDDIQKNIFIASKTGSEDEIVSVSLSSLLAWETFVSSYKDEQPEEYSRTRDWDRKMIEILKYEKKANEYLLEKRYDDSRMEKEKSDEMYREIKKENGILEISKEMKEFYKAVEKVVEADTKEDILEVFPLLKLRFTILKELGVDNRYDEFIEKMEEYISKLDKLLDGPDFKNAQSELEKAFFELYVEY